MNLLHAFVAWVRDHAALLAGYSTAFILSLSAITALVQYRWTQSWKRREFAAQMIKEFHKDEEIFLAILCLDVLEGEFPVPQKYIGLSNLGKKFRHSAAEMKQAFDMKNRIIDPHTGGTYLNPSLEHTGLWLYVRLFDQMFERLELLYSFVELKLIKVNDVQALRYWLAKLNHAKYDGESIFLPYLKHYQYEGVLHLLENIGKKPPHPQL